ncbi:MAG TPA: hypothetical protein VGS10_13970 [Terracidiphilus sp.]|nr:hypothetical protein [Terracidiphilus sp.]
MAWRERTTIRFLHLVLSIPIIGFIYGPVSHIPRAAFFTRWIAVPLVVASGLWLWLKPKVVKMVYSRRLIRARKSGTDPVTLES